MSEQPVDEFVEIHIRSLADEELRTLVICEPPVFALSDGFDQEVVDFLADYLAREWPKALEVARQELARRGNRCGSA